MEEALLQLVNKSIEQRKFAKNWKPQLVKPLHKKKEKTLVGNFRPVSNLVEVGKVAEYAVAEQISSVSSLELVARAIIALQTSTTTP